MARISGGGMQQQGIKKLGIKMNGLLHRLQDSVGDYCIELEDRSSKKLHKVLDGIISPHP